VSYYCKEKRKVELDINLFERWHKYDEPANVSFLPKITLHADKRIWADAKAGDEYARFVIAHEIGHIVLHDHDAKAFSADPSLRIRFAEQEHSGEWQADTFGEHFLVPNEAARRFSNERLLSTMCGVSLALARKRLNSYFSRQGLLVEAACGCGNYSLVRQQSGVRCFTCDYYNTSLAEFYASRHSVRR
jgi:hypothetical protein